MSNEINFKGIKVVVIDDSKTIRRTAEMFLTKAGCEVITAEDGFDGVPTPIYYTVLDENGNSSNIAQVRITSPCVCDPYELKAQDSIASLSLMGMTLMLFLLSGVALLFIREELATEIK